MAGESRVKQYAIAEELGISPSTVSKVFSNRKDVSEAMRSRVLDAAREMGYLRKSARELSQREKCLSAAGNADADP